MGSEKNVASWRRSTTQPRASWFAVGVREGACGGELGGLAHPRSTSRPVGCQWEAEDRVSGWLRTSVCAGGSSTRSTATAGAGTVRCTTLKKTPPWSGQGAWPGVCTRIRRMALAFRRLRRGEESLDPGLPVGRTVGLIAHDLVGRAVEGGGAGPALVATPGKVAPHLPGGQVRSRWSCSTVRADAGRAPPPGAGGSGSRSSRRPRSPDRRSPAAPSQIPWERSRITR